MGRHRYLVAYDICEPKRLRDVHATMQGFGSRLQYSVFICDLDPIEKIRLRQEVGDIIDHTEDRVMIVNLGPTHATRAKTFEFMGRPSPLPRRGPQVV